jgi:hypothetical protein
MNNDYEDQWKIRSRSVLDVSEKTEIMKKKSQFNDHILDIESPNGAFGTTEHHQTQKFTLNCFNLEYGMNVQ